ncbi:MAG: ligB2 [Herbinix sp.]|nr:ligB2 [Herbinix sp.]
MSKMPVLFVGHGSPMNAVEDNEFTRNWANLGTELPRPKAILSVSAHWYTAGTRICDALHPTQIYDMYGFPKELYELKYPVKGSPELAHTTKGLLTREVQIDNSWGIDHGSWSVLCRMFPEADIPVYQLSIDKSAAAATHYRIGQELSSLREQGVLILGSGNVVHNLSRVNWELEGGYPWAEEFDAYIKNAILGQHYDDVVQYERAGKSSEIAFYTPEHYYPLLYAIGATDADDKVSVYNDSCVLGSLSMTSYLFS